MNVDIYFLFENLGISLLLGLLVGLQRERTEHHLAGFRTFPLVTMFGTLCALLAEQYTVYILMAGFLAVSVLIYIANMASVRSGNRGPGITTEVSLVLMYAVGAFLVKGPWVVAIGIGAMTAVLLQLKPEMQNIAKKIADEDIKAILQFILISFIILPIIPDQTFGPYQVLNPYRMWLMVVLVIGIGLGGYISYKFFGKRAGMILSGLLGGLISSTATTFAYSRRAKEDQALAPMAGVVIIVASSVLYLRVLVEIFVVSRDFFKIAFLPIGLVLAVSVLMSLYFWRFADGHKDKMPDQRNPTRLISAIGFALVYGGVLLASAATRDYLGDAGIYVVALIAGFTDMDAITLSTSSLVAEQGFNPVTGWKVILIASASNLLFKSGVIAWLGGVKAFRLLLTYLGVLTIVAVATVLIF